MNRTDRLLAIVLELQRKGQRRAEDLAATFEISKRTVYRDMQALSEAGVPIVAVTNRGYSLADDYFLPPLSFTTDEALMLTLGVGAMADNFDAQYQQAARSAYRKIDAVVPRRLRDELRYLTDNITIFVGGALDDGQRDRLRRLRRAIVERRTVRLHYSKKLADPGEPAGSERDIDPYSLARLANDWFLLGYCHLRRAIRIFRLARIDRLTVLADTFERPADFSPDWLTPNEKNTVTVRASFDPAVARWVQESRPHAVVAEELRPEGLLVTLRVRQEREVLPWLLGWGRHVKIMEPESLRLLLLEETEQMLRNHRDR